jgi:hypothetical protein
MNSELVRTEETKIYLLDGNKSLYLIKVLIKVDFPAPVIPKKPTITWKSYQCISK